jgi:ribose transport system permease protein
MATPNFGIGLEMTAIASAIIGGASMSGGRGTVFGSILGICLYYLISSSLVLLNVPAFWQDFIRGFVLLAAISIDSIGQMRKKA